MVLWSSCNGKRTITNLVTGNKQKPCQSQEQGRVALPEPGKGFEIALCESGLVVLPLFMTAAPPPMLNVMAAAWISVFGTQLAFTGGSVKPKAEIT